MEADTIVRLYSMTKPVTSVAAMMLYEEGAFDLYDPVSSVLPAFGDTMVWAGGNRDRPVLEPQRTPMAMWNLFTHTSGLTYGFALDHPVDALYRRAGYGSVLRRPDPRGGLRRLRGLPARVPTGNRVELQRVDRRARPVVEVLSGKSLDVFFRRAHLRARSAWSTPASSCRPIEAGRLAKLYVPRDPSKRARTFCRCRRIGDEASFDVCQVEAACSEPPATTTGSPRCSSAGGELDGNRLLGPQNARTDDVQPSSRGCRPLRSSGVAACRTCCSPGADSASASPS